MRYSSDFLKLRDWDNFDTSSVVLWFENQKQTAGQTLLRDRATRNMHRHLDTVARLEATIVSTGTGGGKTAND